MDEDPASRTLEPEDLLSAVDERREAESVLIGDGHGIKACKIVQYTDQHPRSHAGEALAQQETTDSRYNSAIDGSSNVWAPFNSRIDWEVAQWAKLRGPSSTAFSDLLNIPGVCSLLFHGFTVA